MFGKCGRSMSFMRASTSSAPHLPEDICWVCEDISTGYHYGVPSCNGCKTFFRRTVVNCHVFHCQSGGNCAVDKSVRCACRHCRFKKCVMVGMDTSAIQENRRPIGYTKRTKKNHSVNGNSSSSSSNSMSNSFDGQLPTTSRQHEVPLDTVLSNLSRLEVLCTRMRITDCTQENDLHEAVDCESRLDDKEFVRSLQVLDGDPKNLRVCDAEDYEYWMNKDWSIMVEWAKNIEGIGEIEKEDKIALLHHFGIVYLILTWCFYSVERCPDKIVFPNGVYVDAKRSGIRRMDGFLRERHQLIDQCLSQMRKLRIDKVEFAALKVILFMNPDAEQISPPSKGIIIRIRSIIADSLHHYIEEKYPRGAVERYGSLLLFGSQLSTQECDFRDAAIAVDFFREINFSHFVRQILFRKKEPLPENNRRDGQLSHNI